MKIKESLIKEDISSVIGLLAGLSTAYAIARVFFGSPSPEPGSPIPNKNVFKALNSLWDDKTFIKDFAKILNDEGDFDKISKLIKWDGEQVEFPGKKIWQMVNSLNFKPKPVAKRIVDKLIKTSSFKRIQSQYKFSKQDSEDAIKLLFYAITHPRFTDLAKKYIIKATEPSVVDKIINNPRISPWDLVRYDTGM